MVFPVRDADGPVFPGQGALSTAAAAAAAAAVAPLPAGEDASGKDCRVRGEAVGPVSGPAGRRSGPGGTRDGLAGAREEGCRAAGRV